MTPESIHFHNKDITYSLRERNALRKWLKLVILNEGRSAGELHYIFCNDQYLHQLNKQFLNHDSYTDIITFDYSEKKTVSGDIFISIDRTRENAKKFGTSHKNELHRVMLHGLLHLIGYKDKKKEEKKMMRKKEEVYLQTKSF